MEHPYPRVGAGDLVAEFTAIRRRLGISLRVLRSRAGISQEALGRIANVSRNYVGQIERGEVNPTFQTIIRLVAALNMPLGDLLAEYERELGEARTRV